MRIDHSLRPELLRPHTIEQDPGCGCEDHPRFVGALADTLDERTIRYVLKTRPLFEDLRQAVGQVAGMLVLAAAGAKTVTQDHPLFASACETLGRVSDLIRSTQPDARAVHHHRHLLKAMEALGLAMTRGKEGMHLHGMEPERIEPVLEPLQVAYKHLAWAAKALPGFEIVSFDQACCAPQHSATPH